jgi:hypothetical protein
MQPRRESGTRKPKNNEKELKEKFSFISFHCLLRIVTFQMVTDEKIKKSPGLSIRVPGCGWDGRGHAEGQDCS